MEKEELGFGVEIEVVGISIEKAAVAVKGVVGGRLTRRGDYMRVHEIRATDGRVWKSMYDGSLSHRSGLSAEIVSPILRYRDIPKLQEIVRALREAGAKINDTCGIHIHVGEQHFSVEALGRLVKIINKQENIIRHALNIRSSRERWCRGIDPEFLYRLENRPPRSMNDVQTAWYGTRGHQGSRQRYHESRYAGVNLHQILERGTVEFRWFNGTLHAGRVKSYVQFCLLLALKAINSRRAVSAKRVLHLKSSKYDFRVFLLSLGMKGEEYKTARLHLMKHLQGSAAWKDKEE